LLEMDKLRIRPEEIKNIFEAVAHEDKHKWGHEWAPYPPYLGFPCTVYDHVVINHDGSVASCFEFGGSEASIKEKPLIEIVKNSESLYRVRKFREEFNRFITCRDAPSEEVASEEAPIKSDRRSLPIT
jgi:hypothetical protein